MIKKTSYLIAVLSGLAAVMIVLISECVSAQSLNIPEKRALVAPVLNSYYKDKDKFYGPTVEFSKNVRSFLTFSIEVMSDYNGMKLDSNGLYENYPTMKIYPGDSGSLAERMNFDALDKAAEEYAADIVIASEVTRAAVDVKDLVWGLETDMNVVVYDPVAKVIISEKTYNATDTFTFQDVDEKKMGMGSISMSGRPVSFAELEESPIRFGGLVTGYPFITIAEQICADIDGISSNETPAAQ